MAEKFEENVEWVDEDGNIDTRSVEAMVSVAMYLHNISNTKGAVVDRFKAGIYETVSNDLIDYARNFDKSLQDFEFKPWQ